MAFSVGQKVISLQNWNRAHRQGFAAPVKGAIYTVRAHCNKAECPAILLVEIVNTRIVRFVGGQRGEPSFGAMHFRPIQTTSIEDLLTQEAPKDSAAWDNRRKTPAKKKERIS